MLLTSYILQHLHTAAALPAAASVHVGGLINTVLPEYASADIDFWHNTTMSGGGWGNASIIYLDLDDQKLQNIVRALEPLTLRIGGSQDDICKYEFGEMSVAECIAPTAFRGTPVSLCLTHARWDAVLDWYNATKAKLVLGVSYFTNAKTKKWNSSNVEALLAHTARRGFNFRALELGEEMAPTDHTAFEALVDGYGELKAMVQKLWPDAPPLILGPSCGMGDETKASAFMGRFLNATIARGVLGGTNMHSYNNDGGWPRPGFLSETLVQANAMREMTRAHSADVPLWCGECGPHNGGGGGPTTGADKAVSSFWYLDALGGLAVAGFEQHGRQALVGSNYGLLQETSHTPNPDFWTLLGWKRFMGTAVLNVSITGGASNVETDNVLHVYGHCTRPSSTVRWSGAVTLAFINIDALRSFTLNVSSLAGASTPSSSAYDLYQFSAPKGLMSTTVALNGAPLSMEGDAVPSYAPMRKEGGTALAIAPLTWGFAVFPNAYHPSCSFGGRNR